MGLKREDAWETLCQWEWFRREQWRPGFREAKAGKWGGSSGAFKKILEARYPSLTCTDAEAVRRAAALDAGFREGTGSFRYYARES